MGRGPRSFECWVYNVISEYRQRRVRELEVYIFLLFRQKTGFEEYKESMQVLRLLAAGMPRRVLSREPRAECSFELLDVSLLFGRDVLKPRDGSLNLWISTSISTSTAVVAATMKPTTFPNQPDGATEDVKLTNLVFLGYIIGFASVSFPPVLPFFLSFVLPAVPARRCRED